MVPDLNLISLTEMDVTQRVEQELPFLVFFGYDYAPQGGWTDFLNAYPTLEKAILYIRQLMLTQSGTWAHVVDIRMRKIVWEYE